MGFLINIGITMIIFLAIWLIPYYSWNITEKNLKKIKKKDLKKNKKK